MAEWSIAPVIDWLMHKGRHLPAREDVVSGICERVRAAGMPIDRVAFFFFTLHPQYAGVALFWDGQKVSVNRGEHGFRSTPQYLTSPAARFRDGERAIRRRLEDPGCAPTTPRPRTSCTRPCESVMIQCRLISCAVALPVLRMLIV